VDSGWDAAGEAEKTNTAGAKPRQGIQWVKANGMEPARTKAGRKALRMILNKAIMK
jgi:hypothetical protein